jgi:uncharacterized damage-inducible protein DinB
MATGDTVASTAAGIDVLVSSLADTPRRLAALTHDVDDARLRRRPGEGVWSVNDVLAHLRACADVWGGSILLMIDRDHPTVRYVSPRTWISKTTYAEQAFHQSLRAFASQRDDLVRTLRALPRAHWSRGATFTGTTRGREQTILSYARRIVDHERAHCEQIAAMLTAGLAQ